MKRIVITESQYKTLLSKQRIEESTIETLKISDILLSEKEKKDENNCWDGTTLASVVKFMRSEDWGKPTSSDKDGCQACYRKVEGSFKIKVCFKSNRYYTLSIESRIPVSYDTKASIVKLHPPFKDKKFNKITYDGVWYTSSVLDDSKSVLQIIKMKLDLRELHIDNDYSQEIETESRYSFEKIISSLVDTINQPTQEEKQAAGVSDVHLEHYNKLLDNLDEIFVTRNQMKDALNYINTNFKSFEEWNEFNTSIEEWGKKTPIEFIGETTFWFNGEYKDLKGELIKILEGESSWDNLSNVVKKIIKSID